jgi:hypothetical protein
MTSVRLERVDGVSVFVRDIDLIDNTPVLDLKPYIPYADAFPDAGSGWVGAPDPRAAWDVGISPYAEAQLEWVAAHGALDLKARVVAALSLGPQPHAYRRIKGDVLAVKEWRVTFKVESSSRIVVERISTGYRPKDLAEGTDPVHQLHRAFVARFE